LAKGCTGDAEEVLRPTFFGDGFLNAGKRLSYISGGTQVKLHAADVGFVGDGFGVELETTG